MIYLVCHSGYLNFGDELIAKTWINFLTNKFPLEEIWVDTCNPGVSAVVFKDYKNIRFTDTLWTASRNSIDRDIDYILDLAFQKDGGVAFANGLELIKSARCVHMIGGGYMNSEFYFNYSIIAILANLKKEAGFELFGTGLGLEPIDQAYERIIGEFFKVFSWIDVRDEKSYQRLLHWGLKNKASFSCDDVFLSPIPQSNVGRPGKLIISAQPGNNPFLVVSFLLKLIEHCPQAQNGIEFLTLDAISDHIIIDKVVSISRRTDIIVRDFNDLWKNGFQISSNDFVFSTRFHAHLVASMMGARGLCAAVSVPYYDVKHLSLIEMGSGFDIIGMHDFSFSYDWNKKTETFHDHAQTSRKTKLDIVNKVYGFMIESSIINDNTMDNSTNLSV